MGIWSVLMCQIWMNMDIWLYSKVLQCKQRVLLTDPVQRCPTFPGMRTCYIVIKGRVQWPSVSLITGSYVFVAQKIVAWGAPNNRNIPKLLKGFWERNLLTAGWKEALEDTIPLSSFSIHTWSACQTEGGSFLSRYQGDEEGCWLVSRIISPCTRHNWREGWRGAGL